MFKSLTIAFAIISSQAIMIEAADEDAILAQASAWSVGDAYE